jgi:hypothetical protein
MEDRRPDELLIEGADTHQRLGNRLTWSDGLTGPGAKRCARVGRAAWKNPDALHEEQGPARGYFVTAARKRNPAVPAVANNLVLVEVDLDVPDDAYPRLDEVKRRVAALMLRLGLRFPPTVIHRSRRGVCFYLRPPAGRAPAKVQLTEGGDVVTWSDDGYVVTVPGLHESYEQLGVVYEWVRDGEFAELPLEVYARLAELGDNTRQVLRQAVRDGEPIGEGHRREAVFGYALDRARDGIARKEILAELHERNRAQLRPPLEPRQLEEQLDGAVKYARKNPTETEKARERARRVLDGEEQRTPPRLNGKRKRELHRHPLRGIPVERVEQLPGTPLPVGTPSLYVGVGGLGKSALGLAYAKQVTDHGGSVIVVSYEDAAGAVIRPRFEALGGDIDRLFVLTVDGGEGEVAFPTDLPELDRHVQETGARLVIVDPVSASIDLKLDAHRDQHVRVVLGQLAKLAEQRRVAHMMLGHLNKQPGVDPYFRINGSSAFYNAARLVVTVTPDPADPEWQRIVAAHKFNYGAVPPPERWRVELKPVDSPDGPFDVMTLRFLEVAADVSREDVLASRRETELDKAAVFLEGALADGDWHDSLGLKALAAAQRISERTLKRAAADLDVDYESRGFPRSTYWRLPQSGQDPAPDVGPTVEPA